MSVRLSTGRSLRLFGAHVRRRAQDDPGLRHRAGVVIVGDCDTFVRPPAGSIAFANPKSSTFTVPSVRTLTFAGFRSRWMIPCSCAASSASAICFAIGNASSTGIGPATMRCDRSSARHQLHDESVGITVCSSPWMCAMLG